MSSCKRLMSTFDRFAYRGFRQQPRGIECGERRRLWRNQQRNFRAAEHNRIASFVFHRTDHLYKVSQGAGRQLRIHQFVENDFIDALALLGTRNSVLNSGGFERLRIYRTFHEAARAQYREALELSSLRFLRNFSSNVQPWPRRAMLD